MDISKLLSNAPPPSANRNSTYTASTSASALARHGPPKLPAPPTLATRTAPLPPFSTLTTGAPSALPSLRSDSNQVTKPKPFRCTIDDCDATFGQKGSLTRHIKSRHEKLRPHTCEQCQKSFSALWTLRVHRRNVHLKSKPHKCHLCDKSFGELFNKSKHIAIVHEGKRPFQCPICSRAFGYKGDMRKHVMELHEQSGRPYQCMVPSCGVKFARKRYLRRHENLSHKGHPLLSNSQNAPASSSRDAQPARSAAATAATATVAATATATATATGAAATGAVAMTWSESSMSKMATQSSAHQQQQLQRRQQASLLARRY